MFKKMLGTIVGGALGIAALYVVAKLSYSAGHDIAEAEATYKQLQKSAKEPSDSEDAPDVKMESDGLIAYDPPIAINRRQKIGALFGFRKAIKNGVSTVLSDLINDPAAHTIEAYVHGDSVRVDIKKKQGGK